MIQGAENLCAVLVSPRNPLNIGAAARAISNFGFSQLRLVNPYQVSYREAKSAVNASAILQNSREFPTVPEAIADCALVVGTASLGNREMEHPLMRLEAGGRLIREKLPQAPVAILFGSEKFGLSNDDMSYCHWQMRIPTRREHESMNLGQAVAVCLYELIRVEEEAAAGLPEYRPAQAEQVDAIENLLYKSLDISGYVNHTTLESAQHKLRRLTRRLNLTERDAHIWLGIFRQILWKLEHSPERPPV